MPLPQCRCWNSTASCWCAVIPPQGRCWRPGWKTFPALTGAALAVGCVELPQSRLLLVGGKKGCWLRCVAPDENPGLWLLDMLRRAACGLPQAGGTNWQPYGRAVPDAALTPASLTAEQSASPRPKRRRLGKALVVLLLLALAALAAGWYYTGGDLAALPQKLQSLGAESLPHAGARLV